MNRVLAWIERRRPPSAISAESSVLIAASRKVRAGLEQRDRDRLAEVQQIRIDEMERRRSIRTDPISDAIRGGSR